MPSPAENSENDQSKPKLSAIILAAGKGTRMKSDLPKVALSVADRPMVQWVVETVKKAGATSIVLVVGYESETVKRVLSDHIQGLTFVNQDKQLGTGHAVECTRPKFEGFDGNVLVLAGDGPLIRHSTIRSMVDRHNETTAAATIATSIVSDPHGYGRIVRDKNGGFQAIVEHANATSEQKRIKEIYPSYACFDSHALFDTLINLEPNPVKGEYYLTDVFAMLKERGRRVEVVDAVPPEDVLSINTPEQLAVVDGILRARLNVTVSSE